jgi:hypothetical protein
VLKPLENRVPDQPADEHHGHERGDERDRVAATPA